MTNPSDRLAKLIPLLGSDQGGEVTAAAGAIGRFLLAQGKDWHDLARAAAAMFTSATNPLDAFADELRRAAEQAERDAAAWQAEKAARAAKAAAEAAEREAAVSEFKAEMEARLKARREAERQRRARMTPQEKAAERNAKRWAREMEELNAERERERMAMASMSAADRIRLKERIAWCLASWTGPQDLDWHYLTDTMTAARIGHWVKISPRRVEEIRRRVAGEPEPEARQKRKRTRTTRAAA